jgi:4-aminobutyrate aminotransferase/(S)-3-amino-2-methylpropionate transaminase
VSSNPTLAPELVTDIPGPKSRELADRLKAVESRGVTCLEPDAPIFWQRARGGNVWDVDGNRFIDLDAAFGVASAGHGHPRVVGAIAEQAERLLHGMGDVHPTEVRTQLLERLVSRFPGGVPAHAILLSSGSDAVEAALKTALLATGHAGVVAFKGAYHGLSLGALDATWRNDFREPFSDRLAGRTVFADYGDVEDVARCAREARWPVGAVLVEPIQGRGGNRLPRAGFLRELRQLCDEQGWLLVVDEIYTGIGRTGRFFACEHEGVIPDLLCVGKALAGGMPLSACLGRTAIMDAWPISTGEALHTQTYLGHPASCAAALATLAVIDEEKLVDSAEQNGAFALRYLKEVLRDSTRVREVRGLGMMLGIECTGPETALGAWRHALQRGVITLPCGDDDSVVSITPPLGIQREIFGLALDRLCETLT